MKIPEKFLKHLKEQGNTSQKKAEDILVHLKVFNPYGAQTWFIYEYDPKSEIAWCFANLGDKTMAECGTVSMKSLKEIKVPPFNMPLEVDKYWEPRTLAEVIRRHGE